MASKKHTHSRGFTGREFTGREFTGRVYRSDDYLFMGFVTSAGLMIKAGCRLLSPDDYRKHVAKEYPATPKATETLRIIQYIEDCAKEQK